MATALEGIPARLPPGVRARVAANADLERLVEFDNGFADAAHWTSPASARELERANPQPNRLAILVESDEGLVAQGQASDGGLWAPPDRTWRVGIRVAPKWRRTGIATAVALRLEAHARGRGASRLICGIRGAEPEGVAFARAAGYREFHRRIDAYIDVASFDESRFEDPDEIAGRGGRASSLVRRARASARRRPRVVAAKPDFGAVGVGT